jgi:hypothetical protein
MQGGKNWILPKELNANWFFWDSHWLEIWSNHFCPSMGPNYRERGNGLRSAQYKHFFPHRTLFQFMCPIAQQPGQAVVQGRLSLHVCIRLAPSTA